MNLGKFMKKFLDIFVWALLLFLITPSGMALASWNAIPGDATYSWKLSLERILIAVLSPSDKLQSSTQVKITERRFSEFEQIVESEYAVEGLRNLNEQIAVTTTNVQKINQDQSRNEVTEAYLASLKKMSASLDEQKTKAKTGQITFSSNQTVGSVSEPTAQSTTVQKPTIIKPPTSQPTTSKPAAAQPSIVQEPILTQPTTAQVPESLTTISPGDIIGQIEETQENIEQIIEELEEQQKEEKNRGKSNEAKSLGEEKRNDAGNRNDDWGLFVGYFIVQVKQVEVYCSSALSNLDK